MSEFQETSSLGGYFDLVHRREGHIVAVETFPNLVTNAGLQLLADLAFGGVTLPAQNNWYLGLKRNIGANEEHTLLTKLWPEVTEYAAPTRPAWGPIPVGLSRYESSTDIGYAFNAETPVAGAFLCQGPVKGSAVGLLYAVGDFGTRRYMYPGDTLTLRYATRVRRGLSGEPPFGA